MPNKLIEPTAESQNLRPESGMPVPGIPEEKGESRRHGRSFIYLTLRDAEEAIRKIDHHAKRMSKDSFARALGHKDPVGRFQNKLTALKDFKLVEDDAENVTLTSLAVDMLYAASEQARAKARTMAFLSYDLFNETFIECPKSQDYQMSYLLEFIRGKLGIVNEVDTYVRRFLESAHYAGLLEGEPNPKANGIRLRPATVPANGGDSPADTSGKSGGDQFVTVPLNEVTGILETYGLTKYKERADVTQRASGDVSVSFADGKISIEIRRPTRVTIKTSDTLVDLPEIIRALREKGLQA